MNNSVRVPSNKSLSPVGKIRAVIRIFPRAYKGYFTSIVFITILGFITGILQGIGVNAIIPLFNFFDPNGRQPTDLISRSMEQLFAFARIPFTLPTVLLFIVFAFIAQFIGVVLYTYLVSRIQIGYESKVKGQLVENTFQADWPYLVKQKLGRLETLIKIDTPQGGGMLNAIATILITLATLAAYLLIAINISKTITVAALLFGITIFALYKPLFSIGHALSKKISQINVAIAHHINESIIGIKTLKALGAEKKIIALGKRYFEDSRALQLRTAVIGKITAQSIQPLGTIFIAIIVAFTFYKTSYNIGALAALVYLIQNIFQYTQSAQSTLYTMVSALPYVENVTSYLEEARKAKENSSMHLGGTGEAFAFHNNLTFNSITFSYTGQREALHRLSFTVKKGEVAGFIGPSGAGKTTIFDLLLRFLRPTEGEITIDGKDIYSIGISDWRRNISYVSQDIFLLTDTVFNNIKFFDESVTKDDVEQAAKTAHIDEFIETLPEKYETIVGERGASLSTGQRQRIALARALARKPKILLLDEATSALDNESEQHIQKAINSLRGEVTVLIIAHRISTVFDSDKLLAIENGNLIEEGSPHDLLKAKDTYFYKVYNLRN